MDKSIARLNIEHYQKLLKTDLDEAKRQTILRLLAEEEATLMRLSKSAAKPDASKIAPAETGGIEPAGCDATSSDATKDPR